MEGELILNKYGIVYLAMEERTGKTLTSILIAEQSPYQSVLVITKKKALEGWADTLNKYKSHTKFTVVNYHQAYKQNPDDYDLIILDEAHNYISAFPKPGKMWKELRVVCAKKPIIYLSATPHAQGPQMLFHQFKLSSYSPWRKYTTFYKWFAVYGKAFSLEINGINIPQYTRCHEDKIIDEVKHLFISKTRAELGFDHEPSDQLYYIDLDRNTRWVYNELVEHNMVELRAGTLVCDTTMKLRVSLHMLEGGVAKIEDEYIVLDNREKIDFILSKFGDVENLVIMYNYIAEGVKLRAIFNKATILQGTSYAEGVDLSEYDNLVIYSQDFSTARHTQRRARQANRKRDRPIVVNFLLVTKAISHQVYKTVSINKRNFVDAVFQRSSL